MRENATLPVHLAGNGCWIAFPSHAEGLCVPWQHQARPSEPVGAVGPLPWEAGRCLCCWVTAALLSSLSQDPEKRHGSAPPFTLLSLQKLLVPVWVVPALDITVLPQGNISGCCLEAMPMSPVVLVNSALLLSS